MELNAASLPPPVETSQIAVKQEIKDEYIDDDFDMPASSGLFSMPYMVSHEQISN